MFQELIKLFFNLEFPDFLHKIYFFIFWFILWFGYFLIVNTFKPEKIWKKLSKKGSDDIKNRVVSITHGLFSFCATAYHIFKHNPQYNEPISNFQHFLIIVSVAYFSYDLIVCICYDLTDFGLYIHHILVIFGYFMDEYYGYGGTETLMGLFLAEISNSPMHMRKILRSIGLRYTNFHEILELIYFVSYVIARGFCIPVVVYNVVQSSNVCFFTKFVSVGLLIQSCYYMKEMTQISLKTLKYYNERKKKNISYFWFTENPEVEKLTYFRKEDKQKIF